MYPRKRVGRQRSPAGSVRLRQVYRGICRTGPQNLRPRRHQKESPSDQETRVRRRLCCTVIMTLTRPWVVL
nr:MAG TPA: hypothetical protein [Caudoviricetes sp.]